MENQISFWWLVLAETIAISTIGSLLHFTYGWSGKKKLVGVFSAVNESTWEHVKLALSGTFCCMLADVWFLGENPNYWIARSVSFVVPVIVIPAIFYSYTDLTHKALLPVDITTFVIASFISSLVFAWMLTLRPVGELGEIISMVISTLIIVMYLLLTRFPVKMFLFRDPLTGKYGYNEPRKVRKTRKQATKNVRKSDK